MFRFWRVHFPGDDPGHWVNIDCGRKVSEPEAVRLARRAWPHRGAPTNAVADFDRIDREAAR